MVIIKGWTEKNEDNYICDCELNQTPYRGSESRPEINIDYFEGKGYPYHKGWYVTIKCKSKYIRKQRFNTKSQAIAYAIKYMRSHPNG